jgi:hypothetical protein
MKQKDLNYEVSHKEVQMKWPAKKSEKKKKGKKKSHLTAAVLEQKGNGINQILALKEMFFLCRKLFAL